MTARTRSLVGWGAILLLAITLAWEAYSPYHTLASLRDAARDRDSAAFSSRIDFPALRASMKEQMQAAIAAKVASDPKANALASVLAGAFVDRAVDTLITPQMIEASFRRGDAPKGPIAAVGSDTDISVTREGLDAFVVGSDKQSKGAKLVFTRSWPGWKLSGVRIPPEDLGS